VSIARAAVPLLENHFVALAERSVATGIGRSEEGHYRDVEGASGLERKGVAADQERCRALKSNNFFDGQERRDGDSGLLRDGLGQPFLFFISPEKNGEGIGYIGLGN